MEPEVYYLHEVCHSCTKPSPRRSTPRVMDLGHSWRSVPQTDAQGLKKKQCSLGDFIPRCVREPYLVRAPVCLSDAPICSPLKMASNLRLRLVLEELASRGNVYPMMAHGRPGRGSKTRDQARCVRARIWSYNAAVWITAGWHASCR